MGCVWKLRHVNMNDWVIQPVLQTLRLMMSRNHLENVLRRLFRGQDLGHTRSKITRKRLHRNPVCQILIVAKKSLPEQRTLSEFSTFCDLTLLKNDSQDAIARRNKCTKPNDCLNMWSAFESFQSTVNLKWSRFVCKLRLNLELQWMRRKKLFFICLCDSPEVPHAFWLTDSLFLANALSILSQYR